MVHLFLLQKLMSPLDRHSSSSPCFNMSGILYFQSIPCIDHLEEQEMEVEAMQAVFMDDFECAFLLHCLYNSSFTESDYL